MARDHLAMIGTDIVLSARIKGMPIPKVAWKKNDAEVPERASIETTVHGSKLQMLNCQRSDCGNYTITIENAAGSKSATCTVLVLGVLSIA